MFGSEAFCGFVNPDTLNSRTDLDGVPLHEAMLGQGLDPIKALDARRDPESVDCYLELHIEQGPVLDNEMDQVGIVEHITGHQTWSLRFTGEANHHSDALSEGCLDGTCRLRARNPPDPG